jgi:hypothetical protein
VPAPGRRGKNPFAAGDSASHVHQSQQPRRERDSAPGIFRLAERHVEGAIPHVFLPQPETLVGPQAAVNQDGSNIAEQERVCGFGWLLAAHGCPDAFKRAQISLLDGFTDGGGAFQIAFLFVCGQNAVAVIFAREHLHFRKRPGDLAPFRRQLLHPPQDL